MVCTKKAISIILLSLVIPSLFAGCGKQAPEQEPITQTTTIGNPWSEWDSIEEAESAVGFLFGLPEIIADSYRVTGIRTMNNKLIEVVYNDGAFKVCVRKQAGVGEDISGDYNKYESCTETSHLGGTISSYYNSNNDAVKQIISYDGYSWSLVAPTGYPGDSNQDFLNSIWD